MTDKVPRNKWGELDEHPEPGLFHIRHDIPAARDTGYLFGKNFTTLRDALAFADTCTGQVRLLIHIEGERWLLVREPWGEYFVPVVGKN